LHAGGPSLSPICSLQVSSGQVQWVWVTPTANASVQQ